MVIIDKNNLPSLVDFKLGTVLLIDKPKEWTSFDVVNKIRGMLKHKLNVKKLKVGHAGTLDPMATGLLILCTGKYTKKIDEFQAQEKRYVGSMLFGATTPSYDAESEIDETYDVSGFSIDSISNKISSSYVGDIQQIPPMFSAVKINGQRLYKLARKGTTIVRQPRNIKVYEYKVITENFPIVEFDINCSKGTYIRSLVHDLAQSLDSGAYMTSLKRTSIGEYQVSNALTINEFETFLASVDVPDILQS